jgi:hypothetical protein
MMRLFRNTTAVLVLTLFTGLAVFTAVQLGGRLFGTSPASALTVTSQPAQSETGSGNGGNGYGYGQGSGQGSGQSYSDPYGYGGSGSSTGDQTYTCPATGCTASTCHASQ